MGTTDGRGKNNHWVDMDEVMLMEMNEREICRGHMQKEDDDGIEGRTCEVFKKGLDG